MISSKNLDNNISIIQNCYNIEDRLTHYQLALHSSKLEAGPLVLLEYLSQGVPFLSFKTGEVVDKIKEMDFQEPEFTYINDTQFVRATHKCIDYINLTTPKHLRVPYEMI